MDELCYEPTRGVNSYRQWRIPGPEFLRFGIQGRRPDQGGRQKPVLKGKEEAEDKCDGCQSA